MPIPLLAAIVIGGSALIGLFKGGSGVSKIMESSAIAERALRRHKLAVGRVNTKRNQVERRASVYGKYIKNLVETTFGDTVSILDRLGKNASTKGFRVPESLGLRSGSLPEFKQKILQPAIDSMALMGAVGTGAATGAGAAALVGLFGTASTGTAIASLSGAAATNATLAWLGGGSIAAGGGGMAAGSLVLGGIAAAPALFVAGLYIDSKGEKALTQAHNYDRKINVKIDQLKGVVEFLDQVVTRIDELDYVLKALNRRTRKALSSFNVKKFNPKKEEDLAHLTLILQHTKAMAEIARTPVIDGGGNISIHSHKIHIKYLSFLEKTT